MIEKIRTLHVQGDPKNRLSNISSRDKNSAEPSVMKSTSITHLNYMMHSRGQKVLSDIKMLFNPVQETGH